MASQPSPAPPDPRKTSRDAIAMTVLFGTGALMLALVMGLGNPLTALLVTMCTANLGLAVIPLALRVPPRFYRVNTAERWPLVVVGVPLFGRLLDLTGWNRTVALPMRQLPILRDNLPRLLVTIHATEGAHAIAFLPHVALAAFAYADGQAVGALWLLLPGIVLHLYPVLLQRWMTLRVAPMVERAQRT